MLQLALFANNQINNSIVNSFSINQVAQAHELFEVICVQNAS